MKVKLDYFRRMQAPTTLRITRKHAAFMVAAIAIALGLYFWIPRATMTERDARRLAQTYSVMADLQKGLRLYVQQNGRLPPSLEVTSLTVSQIQDIKAQFHFFDHPQILSEHTEIVVAQRIRSRGQQYALCLNANFEVFEVQIVPIEADRVGLYDDIARPVSLPRRRKESHGFGE